MKKHKQDAKFKNALNGLITNLKMEGDTNRRIADLMNISTSTFSNWVKQSVELSAAIQQGKDSAIDAVEANLFRRALGFYHMETKVFCTDGMVTTCDIQKFIPGDVGAMCFLLKNARPDKWRDKPANDPGNLDNIIMGWKPKSIRNESEPEIEPDIAYEDELEDDNFEDEFADIV